jgi:large subunit ribosomal protein L10
MSKYIAVKKTSRERKEKIINELVGYLKNYKYFIIADLFKIKSADLQALRKIFYDSLKFKVVKNSLFRVALKKVYEENTIKKLEPYLQKQNIFIFSNANPYEIYLQLEKNKIKTAAAYILILLMSYSAPIALKIFSKFSSLISFFA